MKLLTTGKVKDVYDDGDTLVFKFSNRISVFDKIIPNEIDNKGESLCRTSAFWFQLIESYGMKSHFIELIDNRTMRVRKFAVPNKVSLGSSNYVIPLEFITRYYVAGSLYDRIKEGKVKPMDIGLKHVPEYGEKLIDPIFEATTKREETDRLLTKKEAMEIGGLTLEDYCEIMEAVFKIDRRIDMEVSKRGLIHADGKKEIALDRERRIVVVDTFGTADEDRFWDEKEYDNGRVVELSKEMVRQYYRSIGYHDKLYYARENGLPEPDIPALSDDMVSKVSDLYRMMFEKITGQKW
ncbi:phosphoribosylaminoimidazole succinocarboxyamide synthase [Thermoplasma volcanium GSS1]|uniref:Phosphoribosylaminoimidazole-succinocarboxamide synthase n=1 Tax=Thermoplasma volcanium (strain ATCC 51530 / DSM 4299 / JCM 9571 / NBRC 15438 / GSS1) TaxID=273116 RepID=PUR7_THEVO|nr:phosphoribosylaminoimidazolesuccinocarboxamide synthase [Thermoplasma volcanium]Q978V1.1 RecName: Full=Phosphoribosylaminoimidazole-succinocarboxamide synthase; AltName: Full=SAICAR synthetase [Thermoplasma volcanium GSS1]BAB60456.1 phosphoribosylaminoimidazole succinocarboxyamide synthase [Thermoplasma volcanium GSS1]